MKNRLQRLSSLLKLLSKGNSLSTPKVIEKFDTTKKII